ncbi:MAG: preprotein translocase subunit YajC [Pseudomonadota bacterium]
MNIFPTAFAATSTHPTSMNSLWVLVLFLVFIYFIMWYPQSKRMKQHRKMLSGLKVGDEIVTAGGLAGKVMKLDDNFVAIHIAENVKVSFQKSAVSSVLPKGTLKF